MAIGTHFTDYGIEGKLINRKIGTFLNYRNINGIWAPIDYKLKTMSTTDIKNNLKNILDPGFNGVKLEAASHCSESNALKSYFGNSDNKENNSVVMTVALSDNPNVWVRYIALNTEKVEVKNSIENCYWENAWKDTDIELNSGPGEIKETIILKSKNSPKEFSFAVEYAQGMSMMVANDIIEFYNAEGALVLKTKSPWGVDSSEPKDEKNIRVNLIQGNFIDIKTARYPTIMLKVNNKDLEQAVYPVKIDPTTIISGAVPIEDEHLYGTNNYGAGTGSSMGVNTRPRLWRIDKTLIPAGTITSFYFNFTSMYLQYGPLMLAAYRITAANDWTEGRGTGTNILAGEPSTAYCKYNTQAWAGSASCGTSGVDYYADSDPPVCYTTSNINYYFKLRSEWATDWRDNVIVNNGFKGSGIAVPGYTSNTLYIATTEHTTVAWRPTFDINYLGDLGALNRITVGSDPSALNQADGVVSNIKVFQRPTRKY